MRSESSQRVKAIIIIYKVSSEEHPDDKTGRGADPISQRTVKTTYHYCSVQYE